MGTHPRKQRSFLPPAPLCPRPRQTTVRTPRGPFLPNHCISPWPPHSFYFRFAICADCSVFADAAQEHLLSLRAAAGTRPRQGSSHPPCSLQPARGAAAPTQPAVAIPEVIAPDDDDDAVSSWALTHADEVPTHALPDTRTPRPQWGLLRLCAPPPRSVACQLPQSARRWQSCWRSPGPRWDQCGRASRRC